MTQLAMPAEGFSDGINGSLSLQTHSVLGGGHIAVVTPLPVLKELATPATTTASCSSPCSSVGLGAANPTGGGVGDFAERPAGTTMITFSCEKKLFPKKQVRKIPSST